ncbi:unnamed protein product [Camellia sinensis]
MGGGEGSLSPSSRSFAASMEGLRSEIVAMDALGPDERGSTRGRVLNRGSDVIYRRYRDITSGAHACGEEGRRPCDESQKGNLSREALSHLLKLVESRVHTSSEKSTEINYGCKLIPKKKLICKSIPKKKFINHTGIQGTRCYTWKWGIGRLAQCFLDSLATLNYPAWGYGLRYKYGLFKQLITKDGQEEVAESWLEMVILGEDGKKEWVGGEDIIAHAKAYEALKKVEKYESNEGKTLRLKQQYTLCSASLQDIIARFETRSGEPVNWDTFPNKVAVQMNDTHLTLCIPELKSHIDGCERFELEGSLGDKVWAALAVNGVAEIHSEIVKREVFNDFYKLWPEKFQNKTNGVTPRRWIRFCNPHLSKIITKWTETEDWLIHTEKLADLRKFADNEELQSEWREAKRSNKMKVVSFLKEKTGYIVNPDAMFDVQVSFVNSIATIKGGTHVDYVTNQITNYVMSIVNKKNKNANLKAHALKIHLWVFVNALIDNLAFDFQTKETLAIRQSSFGSKCELSQEFLKKDFKQSKDLKKIDGTKRQRITGITKLEDANDAGGKSSDKCTLILTEGVSAKALAMAGISVVGQNYYGVFPLRGKLLNVREASHKQIMEKAEIQSIKHILGLQHGKQYDSVKTLRYGHLMIMTDQVKHSRTSSPSSYEMDFCELVDIYTRKKRPDKKKHNVMLQDLEHDSDSSSNTSNDSVFEADRMSPSFLDNIVDDSFSENDDDVSSSKANQSTASNEKKLSVEYLEDECDLLMGVDDLDVVDITNIDHASARYIYTRLLIMRVLAGLEGFLNKGSSADGSFVKPGTSQQNLSSFQSQAVQSEAGKNFTEMEGRCSSDLYRNTSEELFLIRKILTEKIAQLNSAIDDVSSQLRADDTPNGTAVSPDELEASI